MAHYREDGVNVDEVLLVTAWWTSNTTYMLHVKPVAPPTDRIREQQEQDLGHVFGTGQESWTNDFLLVVWRSG